MLLNIMNDIEDIFNKFGKFVEDNYSNPFLWIVIFVVLLVLSSYVISNLGDK